MNGGRPISEDDLHAYIDHSLDSRRHSEVEAYLAAHPAISARVSSDLEIREALRSTLLPIADEPLPAELSLRRLIDSNARPARDWPKALWQVAAALALMVVSASGGWAFRSAQEPPRVGIAALAREAAESYAVYAPDEGRPVEIEAADAPQFVKWASRRLARPISIPDLSVAGYAFIGGRVVPTPHGPAVLYMFDNGQGTRLALLSRNMEAADRDAPMALGDAGPVSSVSWARDGLGYSLVGPLAKEVLHPIADAARVQFSAVT